MLEPDVDRSRDLRLGLCLLAIALYGTALANTAVSISLMVRESFTRTESNARILIFLVIADVALTVGTVFAVRSVRTKDPRLSWRLLGWTGIAFVVGVGLLLFETVTADKY